MRKIYDLEFVKRASLCDVATKHQDWPHEKMKEYAQSEEQLQHIYKRLLIIDLKDKMTEESQGVGSYEYHMTEASWIINNIQPELIQNINEYLDGMPLTPIKIHGKTVEDIMHQYGEDRPIHFFQALSCMVEWKNTGYKYDDYCFDYYSVK